MTEGLVMEKLTDDECWQLLARKSVGRLAVSIKNEPDVFPVNYRVDADTIVIQTAPGIKLAAATLGSAVAFEVDDLDEMLHSGISVVVKGKAVEIERLEELLDADDLRVDPWVAGPKTRYIRIVPATISGRRLSA